MWEGLTFVFLLVSFAVFQLVPAKFDCDGHIEVDIVYGDTQVEHARINRTVATTVVIPARRLPESGLDRLPTPIANSQAGENGITVSINNRTLLLFPMGRRGLQVLYLYDTISKTWDTIHVHCLPQGVALRDRELVGFCVVNTSIWCVPYSRPYFKLTLQDDGSWADDSGSGLCSCKLSTTNLTNSVILQYGSQYGHAVKLYFAEEGTNRLHEIDLGEQESNSFDVPDYGQHELKVSRLVSAVANDGSYTGLRLESSTDSSNNVYHVLFSSTAQSFSQKVIQTETIAFNSPNLKYLVTFTANHKKMIVIPEDGAKRQQPLDSSLRDPIRCENIAGPVAHYLVCLAANSGPILINVKGGTSQTISIGSNVTNIGKLTNNTLYMLTNGQEMVILPVSTPHHLVNLTINNDNLRVMNSIECDHNNNIRNDDDSVPIWPIVLSIVLALVIVIVVLISLCAYKKCKCITDKLSRLRLNYRILDTNQDDGVFAEARQCSDKSVVMPEQGPRPLQCADGRPS